MSVTDYPAEVAALCNVCHDFGERGWCRATSGNFSVRLDQSHCLITQSGREKSRLGADDLMICDLDGLALDANCRPSAETPLHCRLYQLDADIGAVLHTHSVTSTVLSRSCEVDLSITGYEMQKALQGFSSHDDVITVPVFANNQDMQQLAEELVKAWNAGRIAAPGFLISGHGLYAWGEDVEAARRHVEGFEFLFECLWQEKLAQLS